ncbi:hypothetical protein Pmani_037909 [Petrolisthes manimaculis]|uniref:Uncharacterized protein n=1 Tax=Petrolisthes manimaculis TaxID=1843537 RepID=A0AAE1NHA1_9EUCA|nr:hypothetical protein Pmani_037909 [Petrolisthes manimaculis]
MRPLSNLPGSVPGRGNERSCHAPDCLGPRSRGREAMRLSAYLFLAINLGDRGVVTLVRATSWKALNPVAKTSKKTGL